MAEFNALDIAYVVDYLANEQTCDEGKTIRKTEKTKNNKPKWTGTRTHIVAQFVKWLRSKCVPQWEHKPQLAKFKREVILIGYSYWLLK